MQRTIKKKKINILVKVGSMKFQTTKVVLASTQSRERWKECIFQLNRKKNPVNLKNHFCWTY